MSTHTHTHYISYSHYLLNVLLPYLTLSSPSITHCHYCVGFQYDDPCESRMGTGKSQEPQHTEGRSG